MSSLHSIGAMNQLADALDAAGFSSDDVTRLKQYKNLSQIKQLLNGNSEIVTINRVVDCDADPFCPNGWKVEEHKRGGQFEWDSLRISLYLSKFQMGGLIVGNKLRKELEGQSVLNACVLDYLLAHPELIPEEWKGRYIFFWGTIFRDSGGYLVVRCLRWVGDEWDWDDRWLDRGWDSGGPAALRAS